VKTLLIATLISVALWFIPYAEYLVYPIRLFVTFIHEGGHALAAVLTGSAVYGLKVLPDASGEVMAGMSNSIASIIVSSAGYLGATAYGVILLLLIRRAIAARVVLAVSAGWIALLTFYFGLLLPMFNPFASGATVSSVAFTVISGSLLTLGLLAIAKFANRAWAQFSLAFLAVQCILNALTDLKTVLFLSTSEVHTDAVNMYNATGIPSMVWVFVWIGIAITMLSFALRVYAVRKAADVQQDLPFED
jgi:Peptidase M50B-like